MVEILASPNNRTRKNTLFSSIPETNNPGAAAAINLHESQSSSSAASANRNLVPEKLLVAEEHPFKIQDMTYCSDSDMLSVGLSNGQIVNYTLEIESFVYTGDRPLKAPKSQNLPHKKRKSLARSRKI